MITPMAEELKKPVVSPNAPVAPETGTDEDELVDELDEDMDEDELMDEEDEDVPGTLCRNDIRLART